jgi:hypothetical protein
MILTLLYNNQNWKGKIVKFHLEIKNKSETFYLVIQFANASDIEWSSIHPSVVTLYPYISGGVQKTGNLKYSLPCLKSGGIVNWGTFDSISGILAKFSEDGEISWAKVVSGEWSGLVADSEEEYVTTVVESIPNGFDVYTVKMADGQLDTAFQFVRLSLLILDRHYN